MCQQVTMSKFGEIKWITNEKVKQVLTWDRVIPAMRDCLAAYSRGPDHPEGAINPLRTWVRDPKYAG